MGNDTDILRKAWWKNVELWVYSATSTFIGGGASSVAAIVIDPVKFNIHDGLANVGKMFVTAGVINLVLYLKQSPLPKLPNEPTSNTP